MSPIEYPLWATLPTTLLLVAGGLLTLIGSLGLLRLPDFFMRMHGPSMGNTLGTGFVLVASMIMSSALLHRPVAHEIIITVFLVVVSPVTAMMVMRAARYRTRINEERRRQKLDEQRRSPEATQ